MAANTQSPFPRTANILRLALCSLAFGHTLRVEKNSLVSKFYFPVRNMNYSVAASHVMFHYLRICATYTRALNDGLLRRRIPSISPSAPISFFVFSCCASYPSRMPNYRYVPVSMLVLDVGIVFTANFESIFQSEHVIWRVLYF